MNQSSSLKYLLVPALALFLSLSGCDSKPENAGGNVSAGAATVALTIDFNGRKENKEVAIPCSDDSTVFDILDRAKNIGDCEFESRGSGETAFVVSIDGVENEKADGDNWTYRVNDKLGDKSCGIFKVKPGDRVLWLFGKYP